MHELNHTTTRTSTNVLPHSTPPFLPTPSPPPPPPRQHFLVNILETNKLLAEHVEWKGRHRDLRREVARGTAGGS